VKHLTSLNNTCCIGPGTLCTQGLTRTLTCSVIFRLFQQAPHLLGEVFEDIGKRSGADRVTTVKDPVTGQTRIAVPAKLTHRLISWHHNVLVHPGTERLHTTLRQHYTWPGMLVQIKEHVKHCDACQKAKRGLRGMGKVPLKDVEIEPWRYIAMDLSGFRTIESYGEW